LSSLTALEDVPQRKYDEAKPLFERAIEIGEKTLGPGHPDFAARLNNFAMLLESQVGCELVDGTDGFSQGNYDEAKALFERALGISEKALGKDHPTVAVRLNNLAHVLSDHFRDHQEALRLMTRCVRIFERTLPADHHRLRSSKVYMARLKKLCPHRYDVLQPDTPVRLQHLQSRKDLNGRSASILKFDESKKQYHVTIDQPNEKSIAVAAKPSKLLQKAQGVQIVDGSGEILVRAGSIVGSRLDNATRLFAVQGSGDKPTWAPEAQLRLPLGTLVTIIGVQQKPELNGSFAMVESWDSEAGRYLIRRSASEIVKLKPTNVTLSLSGN